MITLLADGIYKLFETKRHIMILMLDDEKTYVWIKAAEIGEILITSHKPHKIDHLLSVGKYRLYGVKNEPKLTDLTHLELFVGEGLWQGYLLPHGLPTDRDRRNRIIPTGEIITKSQFKYSEALLQALPNQE